LSENLFDLAHYLLLLVWRSAGRLEWAARRPGTGRDGARLMPGTLSGENRSRQLSDLDERFERHDQERGDHCRIEVAARRPLDLRQRRLDGNSLVPDVSNSGCSRPAATCSGTLGTSSSSWPKAT